MKAQFYLSESISLDSGTPEGFTGMLYDESSDQLIFSGTVIGNTGPNLYFTDNLCSPLDTVFIEQDYFGFEHNIPFTGGIMKDFSGYLIVHGQLYNGSDSANAVVIKLNSVGDTIWTKKFGNIEFLDAFVGGILTKDSNYVFVGQTDSYSSGIGEDDAWIVKTDTAGNVIWQNNFGGSNGDYFNAVDTTLNNGFIAAGYTNSVTGVDNDVMVVRVDSDGNVIWQKYFGNPVSHESSVVKTLPNGNFLVYGGWGFVHPEISFKTISHGMAMELDQDGNQLWFQTYSFYEAGTEAFYDYSDGIGNCVFVDDGIVFVGQSIDSLDDNPLGLLIKTDYSGNQLWMRRIRERDNDNYLRDLVEMPGGDFVATGYLFPDAGFGQDGWILRTNCLGFEYYPVADADWLNAASNTVILDNNSIRFGDGIVYWGDGESDTFTEFDDTLISHTYAVTGAYSVQLIVSACYHADTIYTTVDATPLSISKETGFEFRLYPNPANQSITVDFENNFADDGSLLITNLSGRIIHQERLNQQSSIVLDISQFASGPYFVQMSSSEGILVKKLIIQH
ncbi:T9SS type A sorting domain-containing protein [Crocinitomix catalasitica]|nr:T9SS type A sorting domain-containing protein [Crocinitomix catalasitica]